MTDIVISKENEAFAIALAQTAPGAPQDAWNKISAAMRNRYRQRAVDIGVIYHKIMEQ